MAKMKSAAAIYSVHPAIALVQNWIAALKQRTGRSLDEWLALIRSDGPAGDDERLDWLKTEHGFGTNNAAWFVERAAGRNRSDDDPDAYLKQAAQYVEAMYAKKPQLRPIHDRLIEIGKSLGDDVKACPCQTIVPLYRHHVFAQIKPSTNTRIDFGLALAKHRGKLPKRLIDTGGKEKKDRITHRIAIADVSEIDAEVERWLKTAYDLDVS